MTRLRTCVGCRRAEPASGLLRVVVAEGALRPDPGAVLPGRGAWVHPQAPCLDAAQRRRAWPRALRTAGPLDDAAVREWVESQV